MELFTGGTFAVIRKVVAAGWKGGCCSFVAAAPAANGGVAAVGGIIFQTIIGSTRDKSISTLMDVSSWLESVRMRLSSWKK